MLEQMGRHWWTLALRGVLAIVFGLIALFHPGAAITALAFILGIYLLLDGIFALIASFRFSHQDNRWIALLLEGLFGIIIGLLTVFHPLVLAVAIIYLIAAWAIVTGIFEIIAAVQLRRVIAGEWALLLTGIVSLLLGILLIAHPGAGLLASAWLLGIYALIFGVLMVILSLRLRRHVPVSI
jgi:uncharacterized membrane protein HdeD (DUF308 family)